MRFRRYRLWSLVIPAILAGTAGGYLLAGQMLEGNDKSPPPMSPTGPSTSKPSEERIETEPPPKKGDPWKFYAAGDWKNAVVNFGFATGADTGPVEMGRGVAAFKAATADADRFDAIMMETSVEAFGNALATGDTAVCEDAHYNLANAIFERAKSAEKQRALAESKAKSKKAKRRHAITLKYVDGLIRQLENCVEHYQETLLLNTVRNDAQTNLDAVREQIRQLREIRIQVRIEESLRKAKKMKCPGEGECEGECEGSGSGKGKRKGSGAGTGERQNEDEGEDDGADEDGAAPDGIEEETGKGGEDKSNRDLHGTPRAAGETEKRDGVETRETEEVDPGTVSRNEIIQRLKRLSQELPVRERSKTASDHRPPNDW